MDRPWYSVRNIPYWCAMTVGARRLDPWSFWFVLLPLAFTYDDKVRILAEYWSEYWSRLLVSFLKSHICTPIEAVVHTE